MTTGFGAGFGAGLTTAPVPIPVLVPDPALVPGPGIDPDEEPEVVGTLIGVEGLVTVPLYSKAPISAGPVPG